MPGSRKCEKGCTCAKHARRLNLTDEERAQRHRDQSREGMRRYYSSGVCPSCGGRMNPQSKLCQACTGNAPTGLPPEEQRKLDAERQRIRRAADPERTRAQARENNKKHGRRYFLKYKFGLTLEAWDTMLIEQSGLCYLCDEPLGEKIHIDHDRACCPGNRSCGSCIRGLAHQLCNQGVGQFGDDPDRMIRVAENLRAATNRCQKRRERVTA